MSEKLLQKWYVLVTFELCYIIIELSAFSRGLENIQTIILICFTFFHKEEIVVQLS